MTRGIHAQVAELLSENTAIESGLTVYPSCGHVPMDDCRDTFIEDLVDFVHRMTCLTQLSQKADVLQ
jgi:hypothetical protein